MVDDVRPLDPAVVFPPGPGVLAPAPRPLPRRNAPRPLPDVVRDALPEIEDLLDRRASPDHLDLGYGFVEDR